MTQHPHLDPSPFLLEGGPTGILLIHGFTGSPTEMRPVGDFLHKAGLTVSGPRLPGHGCTVEEMNRCKWTDWAAHVEESYQELKKRCDKVFVGGLSMGSLLAMYHAARHPELAGAIAYSPATWVRDRQLPLAPIARHFIKTRVKSGASDLADPETDQQLWCYNVHPVPAAAELYALIRQVRRSLPGLVPPLLLVYSTGDGAIHPTSAQRTYELAGSKDKELIRIEGSGHVITADRQWRHVAEQTLTWINRH